MTPLKKLFFAGVALAVEITGFSERFVLFLIAGGVNTMFYYGVYALLIWLKTPYPVAVVLATACGVAFNFNTFGRFVFKQFETRLIFRFAGVYAVVASVNIAGIKLLELCGVSNRYVAGALLTLPAALLGYVLNGTFVFNRPAALPESRPNPTNPTD
ncbi:MAG TPA: polysaccharide biosynthesis protein GtrA [Alphaproteobacteria bacterium]|nr:polysaccharide biosynthesis protein GtrA [Alphaproteobacteria bacterium]